MKQKYFQKEVLVLTQTSFIQKVLIDNNRYDKESCPVEKLEKGFWNGQLNQMLPELMLPMQGLRSELFIWRITVGDASLLINMAETPEIIGDSYSINQSCFLTIPKMN